MRYGSQRFMVQALCVTGFVMIVLTLFIIPTVGENGLPADPRRQCATRQSSGKHA